jgi:hypothetical protein
MMAQGPHGPQNTGLLYSRPRLSPRAKSLRRLHSRSLEPASTFQKRPNIIMGTRCIRNHRVGLRRIRVPIRRTAPPKFYPKKTRPLWPEYADGDVL